MSGTREVNFDGLIGPSHNYGGLSDGNLASLSNAGDVSNPREAALQGLEKMRLMVRAGFVQGVIPPPPRPEFYFLDELGFSDESADPESPFDASIVIPKVAREAPDILKAAYSASSMWAANAATVSPSMDTEDGRLFFSVANLLSMRHRSIEAPQTYAALSWMFMSEAHFELLPELPRHADFADEGAANHTRLCASHGEPGVHLFVYGRKAGEAQRGKFPARQTLEACQAIARRHGLDPKRTVYARQSQAAIDAGAFHNDVVCVGSLDTLFFHEHAFDDTDSTLEAIRRAGDGLFELKPVMVPDADVPLADAIKSYLFNSQLLDWPGEDRLVLLAPTETQETATTRAFCEEMGAGNGPIGRVEYVDVRQSMRNGGGPACLRLRVVMTAEERMAMQQGVLLDEDRIDALQEVVRETYRDRLAPADLADPAFADECRRAREGLLSVLDLGELG